MNLIHFLVRFGFVKCYAGSQLTCQPFRRGCGSVLFHSRIEDCTNNQHRAEVYVSNGLTALIAWLLREEFTEYLLLTLFDWEITH
jgi:hypothetical protein